MNYAASPNFNPSGRFMAYECKPECQPGDSVDICLYDVAAGTQKVLFHGPSYGFRGDQLLMPRWSPDGNYMIMRGDTTSGINAIFQWAYADMDPATGDSLGSPLVFIRGNKTLVTTLGGDTVYYRLAPRDFAWGPDSRHVVISAIRLLSTGGAYSTEFDGLAIFDFVDLIQGSTLPDVPDITKVVDDTDGSPNYPSFSADGSRLYYDRYHSSSWADLQYTPLADYAPVTFNQKINFLADGYYNRTPALPPPVLPEFFPLVP
jgi:hypothetical protein